MYTWITYSYFFFFFLMIRRPPRSTLFPSRRSSDLLYSTVLDFSLVALMDHCPRRGQKVDVLARLTRRSEEHTSELQSQSNLVCRLLLEKKKKTSSPSTLSPTPSSITQLHDRHSRAF